MDPFWQTDRGHCMGPMLVSAITFPGCNQITTSCVPEKRRNAAFWPEARSVGRSQGCTCVGTEAEGVAVRLILTAALQLLNAQRCGRVEVMRDVRV